MLARPQSTLLRRLILLVFCWALAFSASATPVTQLAPVGSPAFKIFLKTPGVYKVTFEDLREAGLEEEVIDSTQLALSQGGQDVAIWVADGGDDRFGPGDHLEFIGEQLSGHRSYYNEYTTFNVYRLEVDRPDGLRMTPPEPPKSTPKKWRPLPVAIEEHLETDTFLLRFQDRKEAAPEPWYWQRLTHIDPEPFKETLWLQRYRAESSVPTSIKVHVQGWSTAGGDFPDHRVNVYLNGELVGFDEWDGEEARLIEIPEVPAELARLGPNELEIKVPRRLLDASGDAIIDEVILNWIEVRYPSVARIGAEQVRFSVPGSDPDSETVRLTTAHGSDLVVYGSNGSRYAGDSFLTKDTPKVTRHALQPPTAASELHAVVDGQLEVPLAVERERVSSLKDSNRQADYIIIAHPKLEAAIEPLAAFHRQRGLEVTVVSVDQIYDQFNHSILDPHAIRDFLNHAYHHWQPPAPRFVLLVGDASWAGRSGGSSYGLDAERLPEKDKSSRNLIPAGIYEGVDGPSASDNFYVAIDGDDLLPDMALGRFPVTEPEEVAEIVEKTLNYASSAGVGPWRRSILWITDGSPVRQRHSDGMAGTTAERGFAPLKIYPSANGMDNKRHQEVLRQTLDQGQVLVHYFGHGGRYIWRTGEANFQDKNDLFSLKHLDELTPAVNLPLVLSMTCYSGRFDHPTADSMGEKFLRLPGRGAVAVLAASWRVTPWAKFSRALVEELTTESTIGEAIVRAKRRTLGEGLVAKYNLLGDPALELALPEFELQLEARAKGKDTWKVVAPVPKKMRAGDAVIDWLDAAGDIVHSQPLKIQGKKLVADFPRETDGEPVASVRVYVWNESAGIDGMGALALGSD